MFLQHKAYTVRLLMSPFLFKRSLRSKFWSGLDSSDHIVYFDETMKYFFNKIEGKVHKGFKTIVVRVMLFKFKL